MATLFNEIFNVIRGRCITDESASVAAAEVAELVEEKSTSTNTGSTECEQCEHFDISQGVYTVECYSCKRYYGDLFALRASA